MKKLSVLSIIVFVLIFAQPFSTQHPLPAVQAAGLSAAHQGDVIDQKDTYFTFLPLISSASADSEGSGDPLADLIARQMNGNPDQVVGAYVEEIMAAEVVQQPEDDGEWVSSQVNTLTNYQAASALGVKGLLANPEQTGALFSQLQQGQDVIIINGDGSLLTYQVVATLEFQVVTPGDPNSDLIELQYKIRMPAEVVFAGIYNGTDRVVFQTNIVRDGITNWGRMYVVAFPFSSEISSDLNTVSAFMQTFQK